MLTGTRTFRVFVSSTFNDLEAEQDALQNGARVEAVVLRSEEVDRQLSTFATRGCSQSPAGRFT